MSDFVRSRLNYYEVLRVSPTAVGDEIDRAFAREGSVFRPHAFGVLTELCIAYETLRDPVKRQAYDATLGIKREPTLRNRSIGARLDSAAEVEASPVLIAHRATEATVPPATKSEPQRPPHPLAALIAPPAMKPALALGPGAELHTRSEQRIGRGDTPSISIEDYLGVEVRPLDWRRASITVGSVIAVACLMGVAVGWWSIDTAGEPPQPENSVSVSLSPVKPLSASVAPQPTAQPVQTVPHAGLDRPKTKRATQSPAEHSATVSMATAFDEPPEQIPTDNGLGDQAVEETQEASPVAAAMPLPNRVVARTIDKIGYACGGVSSIDQAEAPGVYKVNCTSGQSFQARPVNGRYRFKQWGKR